VFVWFKIALRNLIKNRRRSIITICAILFGYAGINLFDGFKEYMYDVIRETTIYAETRGHLTIFKKGFLDKGKLDPLPYLLSPEEMNAIEKICRKTPQVILVTPQLQISGLVSNGTLTTIFVAQGYVPSTEDVMADRITISNMESLSGDFEGKKLQNNKMYGVAISSGLARLLDLSIGSNAITFSNTVAGQMNALDIEVFQIFDGGHETMNDKLMRVPFRFAQVLYDTDGADRLTVLLDKTEYTEAIRHQLQSDFAKNGLELEIKSWKEISDWYVKVKDMFDIIFIFLFIIVFIIVVMSVANTMSMVVFERIREIGTLRSLGLNRKGVCLLFGIESSLLGVLGTIGGIMLSILGWWLVNVSRLTWTPPGITSRVPINIYFTYETMIYSFISMVFLCLGASFIPSFRASRQNIVDALAHV
jgi:putative ABC transport system permease protein